MDRPKLAAGDRKSDDGGMRRRQPQPKDKRRIPIPDALRAALLEAFEIIRESKRDPDVRVDYDDAIQCGGLVGGRAAEITRYCCRNADCGFKTNDPDELCRCDLVEDPC